MSSFEPLIFEAAQSRIRSFDAYLEILPELEHLLEVTPTEPGSDDGGEPEGHGGFFYPVIGFSISCSENKLPTASVSLPVGQYLTNLSGRFTQQADSYQADYIFEPVAGIESGRELAIATDQDNRISILGAVIWYREVVNDTDLIEEKRGHWKPIFKGVTCTSSFTRVAYAQESLDIDLNHWAYVLDSVIVHNSLINTASEVSTFNPLLRSNEQLQFSISGESESGENATLYAALGEEQLDAAKLPEMPVSIFPSTLRWFQKAAEYSNEFPQLFQARSQAILDVFNANVLFVLAALQSMESRFYALLEQGYTTEAMLTRENTLTFCPPAMAFRDMVTDQGAGQFNGMTYLQALESVAVSACLTTVYTANSVTMEALAYRPLTFRFAGRDRPTLTNHATQIVSNKTFARELVGLVARGRTSELVDGRSPGGAPEIRYAHIYEDLSLFNDDSANDPVLGSLALVNLPVWFAADQGNNWKAVMETPDQQSGGVGGEGGVNAGPVFTPTSCDDDEIIAKLTELLYFQLKSRNRSVRLTLPFDINTCIGMPVCVEDSRNKLYYVGIVIAFTHALSRANDTAHTTWTLGNVEAFTGDKKPTENERTGATDRNPFYSVDSNNIKAFTGRPIYE